MTQRHLIGEVVSWLVVAGLLFALAQNTQLLRRVVGELAATRLAPAARPAAKSPAIDDTAEHSASHEGVELRADRSGHFETSMEINGRLLQGMVDTGATLVVLTYDDARAAGIFLHDSDFTMASQTANGIARFAPVMLDRVAIGSILVRNVKAGVAEPGALRTNLLGMSFLQRLQTFKIRSGTLLLQE